MCQAFGECCSALVKISEGIDPQSGAVVVTYRARTEGSFARIERHETAGVSHFVIRTADNVLSIFGQSEEARVVDPADRKRVFQWLLQEQRDTLGNVVVYRHVPEDLRNVEMGAGCERGRTGVQPQRYLSRILYGNRDVPEGAITDLAALDDTAARDRFMFEIVLDYGGHAPGGTATPDDDLGWKARPDTFSSGRAGFEVRTRRLCRDRLAFAVADELRRHQSRRRGILVVAELQRAHQHRHELLGRGAEVQRGGLQALGAPVPEEQATIHLELARRRTRACP